MRSIFKTIVKKLLPEKAVTYRREFLLKIDLLKSYYYDYKRFFALSGTISSNTETKLIKKIITRYHMIEKGLTMPEARLGFGKDAIILLCDLCIEYSSKYNTKEEQLIHAIGVIFEYERFHKIRNYSLNNKVDSKIKILKSTGINTSCSVQIKTTRKDYFSQTEGSFLRFSNSRKSVRNYTNQDIPVDVFNEVFDLARNTPSACNRQSWRTYLFTEKDQINDILNIQGGNRGFGHLANKVIVIAGEVGAFASTGERNQVFIDGGIYAMNLLYALHYYQIAACILNCSTTIEKDQKLRESTKIKESEVFIAIITCGIPPEDFEIASSKRSEIKRTNTIN